MSSSQPAPHGAASRGGRRQIAAGAQRLAEEELVVLDELEVWPQSRCLRVGHGPPRPWARRRGAAEIGRAHV